MFDYNEAVKLITSSGKFKINPGLERIREVLNIFGNPQDKCKTVHVAGTNGKGSVCAILANILKNSGYNTGLYTSPHLVEYTERIKINGEDISKTDFARFVCEINKTAEKNKIDLTEFEILTCTAYKYFADCNVDIAVIETGLGGRFDATNVLKHPETEIITSISLDHTDRLGNTIEEIASEKAGIIKPGSDVIVSKSNKGYNTIKDSAKKSRLITVEKNADTIFENGVNYAVYNNKKYEFPLLGAYQKENLALVLKGVEILRKNGFSINEKSLEEGLKTVKWRARFEYIKEKNLIIDGAHNPDGALELRKSLDEYFPEEKRTFIYSTLNTKNYAKIAEILFKQDDEIYYFEFNHPNAVKYEEYVKNTGLNTKKITAEETPVILSACGLKIITGSLYMTGEILKKTGL